MERTVIYATYLCFIVINMNKKMFRDNIYDLPYHLPTGRILNESQFDEREPLNYTMIHHGTRSGFTAKIRDLSFILDTWTLFTENRDDPLLDKKIKSAMVGSAYTQSVPVLSLRQLFSIWRKDRAIHKTFYNDDGNIIRGPLYMVGMGGSVLSGAFVFWGIVPSRGLIVISDRSPEPYRLSIPSNILLYRNAAYSV